MASDELGLWYALAELPRAALESAALLSAMPWLALAPRGDGHRVIVIPGFAGDDDSTLPLRTYLDRQGYRGLPWALGPNLGLRRMGGYAQLLARVIDVYRESGEPVSLVGWSLGGVQARAVAKMAPQCVRQVITMGAPISGPLERTGIWRVYESVNGRSAERAFIPPFIDVNRLPPPVPTTAIYSRSDGVVPWQMAREVQTPRTENIEVFSSHIGLGYHPSVFYAIADRLSQPRGRWRPFQRVGWKRRAYGAARGSDEGR